MIVFLSTRAVPYSIRCDISGGDAGRWQMPFRFSHPRTQCRGQRERDSKSLLRAHFEGCERTLDLSTSFSRDSVSSIDIEVERDFLRRST